MPQISPRSNPALALRASAGRYRQVARIIKHLRPGLEQRHPHLEQPSSWMIDCLLYNCPPSLFSFASDAVDWQDVLIASLGYISDQTDTSKPLQRGRKFRCAGESRALFPNQELFDEVDAHQFCSALLSDLEQELHY